MPRKDTIIMTANNFPVIDATDIKSTYKLVDLKDLHYKDPGDTDILQSREYYGSAEEIDSMKKSIAAKGVLESPIVMENDEGEGYRVLEGNRRCHVLNLLVADGVTATDTGKALTKVRVEVKPSVMNIVESTFQDWLSLNGDADEDTQEECREHIRSQVLLELGQDALIRNTQRLNWSPIEMARQIKAQMEGGTDIEVLAKNFGLAVQTVRSRLALLDKEAEMPEVIEAVDNNEVSFSVGKLLANVADDTARKEILEVAKGGDEESKPSTNEVKELIDTKHKESKDAGGEGIKAQDRKKRAVKAPKTPVRTAEQLLLVKNELSTTRTALLADSGNPESENAALDLGVAIVVLQWVMDPEDTSTLESVVLGAGTAED
jgi:ParB-like chromosome segregation protein Spo0J